jgi:hypothetical protein
MFYTINHIFQYHLMVLNSLHILVSCYGYVVLIYHKQDKAFRLSSNEAMTNILYISYFLFSLNWLLMIKDKLIVLKLKNILIVDYTFNFIPSERQMNSKLGGYPRSRSFLSDKRSIYYRCLNYSIFRSL